MCFVGGTLIHTTALKRMVPAIMLLVWGGMFMLEGIRDMMPWISTMVF